MDAMKLLLALCQGLMGLANLPEEAKALIQPVLDEAKGGGEPAPAADPIPAAKPPEAAPAAAPATDMGTRDDELQKRFKKETDAGIDVLLASRDLTKEQSEYVKNECKTLGSAAAYLKTIPLAKPAEKPVERLGAEKAPRGGAGSTTSAPSGDAKINMLFRIMPSDSDNDGVTFHEPKTDGKLVSFSTVGAYAGIKKATAQMVRDQKARMIRGAQ